MTPIPVPTTAIPSRQAWWRLIFRPNAPITLDIYGNILLWELCIGLLLWTVAPSVIPSPLAVWRALQDLIVTQGLIGDLWVSLSLNMEAIACSTVLSLVLAYLSVVPVCRPIVQALGKLRFLSLAGLTFILTVFVGGGHALKLSLLVFGISVFFLTSMLDVVESVTQAEMDYARTLRLSEWRIVWEMRVRGTLGQMFDVLRQTAAMGWVMLTMVEGIVRSEGGIGKMLLDQDKHFTLPAVFAIQAIFLTVGLLQDIFLQWLKGIFARYATLTVAKK